MEKIKIYDVVKELLQTKEITRDSDKYLYLFLLEKLGMAKVRRTILGTQVIIRDWSSIPNFETVTRVRRMIQADYPELRGKYYKRDKKLEKEQSKGTFVFREEIIKK